MENNTTSYVARLVCSECGYVFGPKEIAFIEYGEASEDWRSDRVSVYHRNEIYPALCPQCRRVAEKIEFGTKLSSYCSRTEEMAEIALLERREKEFGKLLKVQKVENDAFYVEFSSVNNAVTFCNVICEIVELEQTEKVSIGCISNNARFRNGELYTGNKFYSNKYLFGWDKEELKIYGLAIDYEKNLAGTKIYRVYFPTPHAI